MEYTPTPRNNYTNAIINGNKILKINYEFSRNQKLFKKYNIHIDDYKTELDLKSNYINMVAQELNIDKNILNDVLNNLHLKLIKQPQ